MVKKKTRVSTIGKTLSFTKSKAIELYSLAKAKSNVFDSNTRHNAQ
jgi:hypothetical protein